MTLVRWNTALFLDGFMDGPDDAMDWVFAHDEPGNPIVAEIIESTGALLVVPSSCSPTGPPSRPRGHLPVRRHQPGCGHRPGRRRSTEHSRFGKTFRQHLQKSVPESLSICGKAYPAPAARPGTQAGTGGAPVLVLGCVGGSAVKICALPLTQAETRSVWAISALV
jgi:hypothetical protein